MNGTGVKNVVIDFRRTDYYGSTALAFLVKRWQKVSRQKGHMAFCNVSDHEREVLRITSLDHCRPICSSRAEALEVVRK